MQKKKILAAGLAAFMMTSSLSGCGEEAKAVITFRDSVIDENEYIYWLSTYKGQLLSSYEMTKDSDVIWNSEMSNGITYGDFYGALFASDLMSNAVWLQLFDENKLELTKEQKESVEDWVDEWIRYCGSKAALNSALEVYSINSRMLKELKLDQLKISAVQQYLFGPDGVMKPTDEELEKYYNENYYRTKFIRLSKTKEYDFDENGEVIYDEKTSTFSVHEITEEEYAAKEALYSDIQLGLKAGEDFEALMNRHTMESGMLYFADGYYFNSASTYINEELRDALIDTEVGEWIALETEDDWYIAKRYELTEKPYLKAEYLQSMFTTLATETLTLKQQEYIAGFTEEIVTNVDNLLDTYPFVAMTPNFYYY